MRSTRWRKKEGRTKVSGEKKISRSRKNGRVVKSSIMYVCLSVTSESLVPHILGQTVKRLVTHPTLDVS